jgi:hypothetical protein
MASTTEGVDGPNSSQRWDPRMSRIVNPWVGRCRDGGCSFEGGDVFVHRCRWVDAVVVSFFIAAPPQLRKHRESQRRCPPSAEPPGPATVCRRPLRRR